jgi:peptide/nickel transport system substrate-binding protein
VIATVSLPHAAQSLTVAGGRLWAAIGAAPADTSLTVVRINPTFDSVSRVKRVPIVAAGDSASLAARGDSVAVAPRSGLLTWIDARDGRTLERTDINAAPNAIAVGFGSTWLAYREANVLLRLEPDGTTTRIPVGRGPSAVAVGEHAVWVADALDDTVKPIDPATNSPITTVRVGSAPSAIAIGGGGVWVANGGDGTLTRIDPRRDRVTATVKIGGSPQALVVVDGKVWVSVQAPPPAQPSGGRAVVSVPRFIDEFDPAVSGTFDAAQILYAACAMLLNYPDEPGAAGLRLIPEAARALPTVSADGRTYTFVIRPGMRFSPPSSQPVTAKTFKYTIERSLSPRRAKDGYGQDLLGDVVGAKAYFAKHARHITGVQAQGDRLTVRLTQPAPDLPTRLAQMPFCAVPTDMPLTPARGAIPSAGPYYIASQTPKRGLVLLRNPNYHGDRPRRLDRIDVIIGAPNRPVAEAEAGRVDYPLDGVPAAQDARLRRLYGAGSVAARHGKQRYFVHRKPQVDTVDLNTRRPLFASRRMRRAVNYAVDRRALAASGGTYFAAAEPADMYLPPGVPGFRETHPYPLVPDLAAARRLAGSAHHTAVLYCLRQGGGVRAARIIAHDLAAIRIDVRVRCMPGDEFWFRILLHPDEPWDMVVDGSGISNDPADFLDSLGQDTGNVGHFHDPRYTRMLRAAKRLSGARRAAAYARIDDELVRDAAPSIAFANENAHDFFSARMGCQVYQPVVGIDLAALCIRPNG